MNTRLSHFAMLAVLTALANATATTSAWADTWTVTSASAYDGFTLFSAIEVAQDGDTIVFAPSLNGQTIVLPSDRELRIFNDISILGPGADTLTLLGQGVRAFHVSPWAEATIAGVTIKGCWAAGDVFSNGDYDGWGGALLNEGTLTLHDCGFYSNTAQIGGAIANFGTLAVDNCQVIYNFSSAAAGIYNGYNGYNVSTMTISNSTVANNVVYFGGRYGNNGGGVWNDGEMSIGDSTISGNSAGQNGGGVFNNGMMTIINSMMTQNSADLDGGGIYNSKGAYLTLLYSTVIDNTAPSGADLYNLGHLHQKGSTVGSKHN